MTNFKFCPFAKSDLTSFVQPRSGEIRLGEKMSTAILPITRFVLLGIEEDIGPQTNGGNPGSKAAFKATLEKLLNMQSNRYLDGSEICILGSITQNQEFESILKGNKQIEELDKLVTSIVTPIFEKGLTPIIVGGGHNNALPIIHAFNEAFAKQLDIVNLDPHADCRALEGRHSGNPFSYAKEEGYLNHYSVLGLHQAYNNSSILDYLGKNAFFYRFFEDYLDDETLFRKDIATIIARSKDAIGIELDLDSIKLMPTSAISPSGFTIEEARKFVRTLAQSTRRIAYFHLPEGAPSDKKEQLIVGKTISYLIHDFLSCQTKK